MLSTTIWHAPEGFHFWLVGCDSFPIIGESKFEGFRSQRFADMGGAVAVFVISEFTEIAISVQYSEVDSIVIDIGPWDRVIECAMEVCQDGLVFESSVAEEFGKLELPPGRYRLRVCYGGQDTRQLSGESADFYLIQIWPSDDATTKILKPS